VSAGLQVTGIAKRFGATVALDGVDLAVRPGEVLALLGENGAGKSTLMNVLSGEVQPDRGEMRLDDQPFAPSAPSDARRRGVALIHQELSLCPHLSVTDNVLLGNEVSHRGFIDRPAARARARALLAELPHPEIHPDKRLSDLSLPARQIVEICRALAGDARVLLMDEPTSSLQGSDVDRLFALIRRLAVQHHRAAIGLHFAREHVHQRALPRPVLTEEREHLAGPHRQVDTVERDRSPVVLRDAGDLQPSGHCAPRYF
jgi:ribose transport system ATP-binding protein